MQYIVFLAITQPLTATQLSRKLGMAFERCSIALAGLRSHSLVRCLNPHDNRNRIFWLTGRGKRRQRRFTAKPRSLLRLPAIDWKLYAQSLFQPPQRSHTHPLPGDAARGDQAHGPRAASQGCE